MPTFNTKTFPGITWVLLYFAAVFFGTAISSDAQCVKIRDKRRNNIFTFTPKKDFRCLSPGQSPITSFTITFEFPVSNVTINWGDTVQTYAGPIVSATRVYRTAGIFNYTITESGCATQIKGIFVNDYNNSCPGLGWIAPPKDSARCLPDSITLKNSSPGMNGFTEWIINWGDLSRDTADYPSFNKNYVHRYKSGSRICNATITISYKNSCNIIPCGTALTFTAGPYLFSERDSALVDRNSILICGPTDVIIKDVSKLNCKDTSNRQNSWTALQGFSLPLPNPGNNIWRPRGPLKNQTITIPASFFNTVPADSTFKVRMRIRNKCGEDTAETAIKMIAPVKPSFNIVNANPCAGTDVVFDNTTVDPFGNVDYIWNFGDGVSDTTNTPSASHVYLLSGNFTVTLTARTKGFGTQICERSTTRPILIKPAVLPVIQIQPSKNGCDSLTAIIKNKSFNPAGATWGGWELGGTPIITAGSNHFPGPVSSDPSKVQILSSNAGDSSAIVKFRTYGLYAMSLKGQTPGCAQNTGTDTIRVFPVPKLRWSISSTNLCQGEPFIVRDSSRVLDTDPRGLGANFNKLIWSLKIGNDTVINSQDTVDANFDSPQLSNRINVVRFKNNGTFFVKLSVRNLDGCVISDSVQVTVKPSAVPQFTFTRQNCDNSNLLLKNLTVANANKYTYKIYKGNGILVGQEFAIFTRTDKADQPIFLPYSPPGDSTFYYVVLEAVTITGGDSCVITSDPIILKIAPTPVPGLTVLPSDGCSPLQGVNVINSSINLPQSGIITFTWTLGSLGTFVGNNPPPLTFTNPTNVNQRDTVKICVSTGGSCSYCTEKVVLTYPQPKAEIIAPDSICSGETVTLSANTIGAVAYKWDFQNYDGSISLNPTVSKVFNNNTATARFFTIKLTVRSSADCPLEVEKIIKVNPNPDFAFQTVTKQDANCGPLKATFTYQNPLNSQKFRWDFGNGDTLLTTSLDTIFKSYGNETNAPIQNTVKVVATSPSGCKSEKQFTFTVNPLVRARFKSTIDSGCTPLKVLFTDSSTIAANIRRWIVNGTPLANQFDQLPFTFTNLNLTDTVYTVKLAVRNNIGSNCLDTMTRKIKVYPKPRPNDLILTPTEGCSPVKVSFVGNVQNAVTYTWDFGDGSDTTLTGQQFFHTFFNTNPVSNQTFTATRYSSSIKGCKDTTRRQVVVRPQTDAVISSILDNGCTPFTAQFSALNSVNASTYEWNFGDGSPVNTSASPNYTYVNNTDTVRKFRVRLIARKLQANACPDTTFKTISVYPAPQSGFTTNTNIGCGPLPITITNTSTGGISSYWVLSSGGISDTLVPNAQGKRDTIIDNPNFAAKTIRIDQTVTSSFGCTGRKTQNIQIYPNLTAEFDFDSTGCQPHLVNFTNTSENFQGGFTWDFGDGSTSNEKNPLHYYENFGDVDKTFIVKLTSTSPVGNCVRERSRRVKVFATPRANFSFLTDSTIQLPENTVTLGNTTPFRPNWTYSWNFDDGTTDVNSDASFVHTFPIGNEDFSDTNFVITLIATSPNGCTDTLKKTMVIKPGVPIAAFEATPKQGCQPLEVQFTSTSTFARTYEWSYVDAEGSPPVILTERNPLVFFETAGLKTVKLKVKGLGGRDSVIKVDYIKVFDTPRSNFTVDPTPPRTIVAPEEEASFKPLQSRPDFTYTWIFGDGDSSNLRAPFHKYATPGTYDVTLMVAGPDGCADTNTVIGAVIARAEQVLNIPTAFTPNPNGSNGGVTGGDGDNDVFYPFGLGLTNITIQIFNRWGNVLFQSTELNKGWDGYYKGKLMPADTYVYRIVGKFSNGESQTFVGDITLLR